MPTAITEASSLQANTVEAATKSGRLKVGIITPGWGSSGYYSAKVLENAADAKVFPAGTQMFLDHPSETERHDRPERSVRDLAAVLTEDATWDGGQLVAEAQVFGPFVDLLTDEVFAESVGVSIRAYADFTVGEAEGRKGHIITALTEAESVDFVTRAGRGGAVLQVLESARPSMVVERAVAHGVSEATANDTRDALATAIRAAYGGDDTWTWVRDFDDDLVWFEVETEDSRAVYQQGYSLADDGTATLADGDPVEVRVRTEYVPVNTDSTSESHKPPVTPAGSTPTHESPEEDTMPQIEESRLAQLEADAGRVTEAEAERDRANARALNAENREAARLIISANAHPFTALETRGLLADLPTGEDGTLNAEKFVEAVTTAAAEAEQARGAGTVTGFGHTSESVEYSEADFDAEFGYTTKEA